jgi:hypothetical protein
VTGGLLAGLLRLAAEAEAAHDREHFGSVGDCQHLVCRFAALVLSET